MVGKTSVLGVIAGAVLMATAGLATGQDKGAKQPDDVLRGPQVKDAGVPGQRGSLAKQGKGARERMENPAIPPRQFQQAVLALKEPSVPADARLSADQEEKLRVIRSDFESKVRDFRQAHEGEIRQLREDLGPEARRRLDERLRGALGPEGDKSPKGKPPQKKGKNKDAAGDGAKPDADPMDSTQRENAAKERLVKLADELPNFREAQSQMWGVLNEKQQSIVKAKLDELRKEGEKKRDAAGGEPRAKLLDRLTPEQREKLKNMTPDERRDALRRLRERRGGQGPGEPKPAPPMDDVRVPKPNSDG